MQGTRINRLKLWHNINKWQTILNNATKNRKHRKKVIIKTKYYLLYIVTVTKCGRPSCSDITKFQIHWIHQIQWQLRKNSIVWNLKIQVATRFLRFCQLECEGGAGVRDSFQALRKIVETKLYRSFFLYKFYQK